MSHYQNFTPPFPIPDSWEWVTIEDISSSILYGVSESAKDNGQYKLLRITDIQNNQVNWETVPSTDFPQEKAVSYILHKGDILFARTGATVGKSYLVNQCPPNTIYASYLIRIKTSQNIEPAYLKYFFESGFYWQQISEGSVGIGQPNVNGTSLSLLKIPIPPKSEQMRIVGAIQDVLSTVNSIDICKQSILTSVNQAKSKILELAMQGKLVLQDPNDESATDMLHRVNPKARIITDNPHSRNIPEGWCVTTLSDLCVFLSRGKSPKYSDIPNQYPVFAQKCNLKEGGISLDQARFLDEATLDKWPVKYRLKTGDVLINSTGTGTVGRTRYFDECCLDAYPFTVPDSHVSVVRSFDEINSKYLFYCLYSPNIQQYFEDNLAGSTNQKELYIDIIGSTQIVLPPVSEQQRIVLKIEELYYVLDKIEASLQS